MTKIPLKFYSSSSNKLIN